MLDPFLHLDRLLWVFFYEKINIYSQEEWDMSLLIYFVSSMVDVVAHHSLFFKYI
jgi:hypothetical protein